MDRTLRITVYILVAGIVGFAAVTGWSWFAVGAYHSSLSGTYAYTLNIATDSPLTNVTFFIPVPEDRSGNSPLVEQYSSHGVSGIPNDWTTTLFSTGKTTVVKITTPAIIPPATATRESPFVISLPVTITTHKPVMTKDPVEDGVMFRPVQGLEDVPCPPGSSGICSQYTIPVYADYQAVPSASVSISSSLAGNTSWDVFGPRSNAYRAGFVLSVKGEHHGWETAAGTLERAIGSYDIPPGA